jgi:hypothetical protein
VCSIPNNAFYYYQSHHHILIKLFSQMAFPLKQVQTLEEQLCIIEEVEKNPSEKRTDVAKQLGLPPSTLNTNIAKKTVTEHTYVSVDQGLATCGVVWCGVLCVEEMCGELGSGSCVEEVQGGGGGGDDEAKFYGSTSCIWVHESVHVCSRHHQKSPSNHHSY